MKKTLITRLLKVLAFSSCKEKTTEKEPLDQIEIEPAVFDPNQS